MFSTWTHDEYKAILGLQEGFGQGKNATVLDVSDLPDAVDWRDKKAVNPVKD